MLISIATEKVYAFCMCKFGDPKQLLIFFRPDFNNSESKPRRYDLMHGIFKYFSVIDAT